MSEMVNQQMPSWDPFLSMENRNPSKECTQRIRSDMKALMKDPLPGIYCVQDETYSTLLHALIIGPFDTPYEGGFFYFVMNAPDDYPHNPPKVKLLTTGGGRVRFNPNLYANGKVCLSILGTWSGPGWAPVNTISSILLSIQSLMSEKPYHNEPGFEAPNVIHCNNYNDCIRHETLRVAVCEMAGETSQRRSIPEQLRDVVKSLFPSFFDSYELTCISNSHKDGQTMVDPFGERRGEFSYSTILEKLAQINEVLLDEEEVDDVADDVDGAINTGSGSTSGTGSTTAGATAGAAVAADASDA